MHSRQIIINFAADRVLRGGSADRGVHAGARLSLLSLLGRLLCSDVMFQICVCDIMRYFTVFLVYCFWLADDMPLLKFSLTVFCIQFVIHALFF